MESKTETPEDIRARADEACQRAGIGLDSETRRKFEDLLALESGKPYEHEA